MELIKNNSNIDFMAQRKLAVGVSLLLIIASIALLVGRGLNFGLDFTGGTLIDISYEEPVEPSKVRAALEAAGYGDALVQTIGSAREIIVRLQSRGEEADAKLSDDVFSAIKDVAAGAEKRRVEFVGPQVGDELANDGGLAMLWALIMISIYIIARFQWKFSIGAVVALVHDVIIILGFFALTQVEFDLTVLAAVLAVIGYSLNDTIVVYDRIRENFREVRKSEPVEIFNLSINQTLSRTVMTGVTTLLVLISLFFLGGDVIHAFAEALIIGVIVGTYSSIYVAAAALLVLNVTKQDLLPPVKDDTELSHIP